MNILVTIPVEQNDAQRLQALAPGCQFRFKGAGAMRNSAGLIGGQPFEQLVDEGPLTPEDGAWANVILGNVELSLLEHAENLKWLQTNSAGVGEYTVPGALPEGVLLTNATGAYGPAISEHMLACLLAMMKKLPLYRDAQQRGEWASKGAVRSISGAAVLVLGMGDIGGQFGKRCKALGARVTGVRRSDLSVPDYAEAVYPLHKLDDLLPDADVVAVTLPGTPQTKGLLDARRIASMKAGGYLLNVGRGSIVDTEALCEALESGRLAGAALDVTDPEPLPPEHRLWKLPNALITPHISGFYHLRETYLRILGICEENLRRFLAGEALENQVDFQTGYRKTDGPRASIDSGKV